MVARRRRIAAASMAMAVLAAIAVACSGGGQIDGVGAGSDDLPAVRTEVASDAGRGPGDEPAAGNADGAEGVDEEEPLPDGVLVWVVGTEPPDLHLDDPANGLRITSWIREGLLESLFGVGPDLTYHLELLAAEPTVTAREDKTVVIEYRLRDDLSWSDGTPLTADDVAYTHRILTEGCHVEADGSILDNSNDGCIYRTVDRVGLDQVTAFEVISETEFTVTMAGFDPDWRRLFSPVLAAHAHGDDAGEVNRRLLRMRAAGGWLPTSGPLMLEP